MLCILADQILGICAAFHFVCFFPHTLFVMLLCSRAKTESCIELRVIWSHSCVQNNACGNGITVFLGQQVPALTRWPKRLLSKWDWTMRDVAWVWHAIENVPSVVMLARWTCKQAYLWGVILLLPSLFHPCKRVWSERFFFLAETVC